MTVLVLLDGENIRRKVCSYKAMMMTEKRTHLPHHRLVGFASATTCCSCVSEEFSFLALCCVLCSFLPFSLVRLCRTYSYRSREWPWFCLAAAPQMKRDAQRVSAPVAA